jgi:hypothetical protein
MKKIPTLFEPEHRGGCHVLVPHTVDELHIGEQTPRDFDGLRAWMEKYPYIEGIVWHHPDGRMAKLKLRDFGIARK